MVGLVHTQSCHQLNIDPNARPIRQKKKKAYECRYAALKEEVEKLISNRSIREKMIFPSWIVNPAMVKKSNGKWRTCVDFTDQNKACPNDSFSMPRVHVLLDAPADHE